MARHFYKTLGNVRDTLQPGESVVVHSESAMLVEQDEYGITKYSVLDTQVHILSGESKSFPFERNT